MAPNEGRTLKGWAMWENPAERYSDDENQLDNLCSAWAKSALAWRTGMRYGHKNGEVRCQSFVQVHEMLEAYRKRFEGGDTYALLQAVSYSAEENVPLPTWLAEAFAKSLKSFATKGGPTSLDDVFKSVSLPTKTPQKLENARRDWEVGVWLWREAWQLAIDDKSITSFEQLVEELLKHKPPDKAPWRQWPVKKTTAKRLILMIDKNQGAMLNWPASKALSQFFAKRRKQVT
jgi:hypothetical protein